MKKILLALVLIPSLASGAGWDETITSPQPDDTIMINDVSQPDGSKTQYTSLKNLPVPDLVTDELDTKVGLAGDETISGIKNFSSSPIVPEPASPSQAATKNYVDTQSPAAATVWGTIIGNLVDQLDLNAALNTKVNNTGTESIGGVKTFTSSPIVPTPTTDLQAATKAYVDQNAGIGGVVWGGITGTLSNQTDLQNALNNKAPILTSDQNYVSDAELLILQQTEGVNTGDQDISNFVQLTGNETIAGVKTFSSSPIVPTPTTGTQAATKDYADTKAPALTADQNYMTDAEKAKLAQQSGTNTGDQDISGFVSKTGNETIQGIKTFSSSPIVPTPTTEFQVATKEYVDTASEGSDLPAGTDGQVLGYPGGTPTAITPTPLVGEVGVVGVNGGTISLLPSGVVAGSYTNATIEVDAKGRLLNASTGASGGGSGYVPTPLNSNDECVKGQRSFDASYTYICEDTDTWDRASITWLDWDDPGGGPAVCSDTPFYSLDSHSTASYLGQADINAYQGTYFTTTGTSEAICSISYYFKRTGNLAGRPMRVSLFNVNETSVSLEDEVTILADNVDVSTVGTATYEYFNIPLDVVVTPAAGQAVVAYFIDLAPDTANFLQFTIDAGGPTPDWQTRNWRVDTKNPQGTAGADQRILYYGVE